MAEKTADELKIAEQGGGTQDAEVAEEARTTPDVEADFRGILKDYGVAEKAASIITKNIAETGTADVFEDPRQLLEKMAKFPRYIPPVTRRNILEHWTSARHIPVPEGFAEEAELPADELKVRKGKGTAPEKYSVDSNTGAIKVASTTDKALTWDEAEQLATEIKKDIEARGGSEKEPAFVMGEQGAWTFNPKAKIGLGEFAVFQMYQESLKRGEPIDPVEEMAKREESSARLREAMGVKAGGEDTEMNMLDKLDKLGMLKKGEGGEGTLLSQLATLGLLKKSGEEGSATQIEMLEKLNQLGMLKKPGEEDAGSSTIRALEAQIKELADSLRKQEMDAVKNAVGILSNQLTELRKEMSTQGKLEGRYALLEKTISTIDSQLTGIRTDAKPLLSSLAGGSGAEPARRNPEEKAKIAKGLKGAVAQEKEARELEDELLFGGKPPG